MSRRSKPRQNEVRRGRPRVEHRPDTAMVFIPMPTPEPKGRCPSGKTRYGDEVDALIVLSNVQAKDNTRRSKVEKRHYPCPDCSNEKDGQGWHLTSREDRKADWRPSDI